MSSIELKFEQFISRLHDSFELTLNDYYDSVNEIFEKNYISYKNIQYFYFITRNNKIYFKLKEYNKKFLTEDGMQKFIEKRILREKKLLHFKRI